MKVEAKAMYMSEGTQKEDGTTVVEPVFFGGGRANLSLFKVMDDAGVVLDTVLMQVSPAGKMVLVRPKKRG